MDEVTQAYRHPVFNEECIRSMCVRPNSPLQAYPDKNSVSAYHVRVCVVRDMKSGATYPLAYVFCHDWKQAKIVATNLETNIDQGSLIPWQMEILPNRKDKTVL